MTTQISEPKRIQLVGELVETSELEGVEPGPTVVASKVAAQPMDQVKAWLEEDDPADIKQLVPVLQELDPLDYERVRGAVADRAGVRKSSLDEAVLGQRGDGGQEKKGISLIDPKPWSHPVNGGELLDELVGAFNQYLFLPDGADVSISLWVIFAHSHDAFHNSPLLAVLSPTMQCGKSTLLNVLKPLLPRGVAAANVTEAALYRLGAQNPCLLIDEADSFLNERRNALRGILNSGHTRGTGVIRCEGDENNVTEFPTFFPKVVASIGSIPRTLMDRSIVVRMRRKKPDEQVERLRLDRLEKLEKLCRQSARWAKDHMDDLQKADPSMPDRGLSDRGRDNWRALIAIADLAGGGWPERARQAAILSSTKAEEEDLSEQLIRHIRAVFLFKGRDRLASQTICDELAKMEGAPWPEYRNGKPLTPAAMAKKLTSFGVRPKQLTIDGKNLKGYEVELFKDVWERYPGGQTDRADRTPASKGIQADPEPIENSNSRPLENDGNPHQQSVLDDLDVEWPGSGRGEG